MTVRSGALPCSTASVAAMLVGAVVMGANSAAGRADASFVGAMMPSVSTADAARSANFGAVTAAESFVAASFATASSAAVISAIVSFADAGLTIVSFADAMTNASSAAARVAGAIWSAVRAGASSSAIDAMASNGSAGANATVSSAIGAEKMNEMRGRSAARAKEKVA